MAQQSLQVGEDNFAAITLFSPSPCPKGWFVTRYQNSFYLPCAIRPKLERTWNKFGSPP